MSFLVPRDDWFRAPDGGERVWIAVAFIWCIVLFTMMPFWYLKGKQNSTGEATRVKPAEFAARVASFVKANKVGDEKGVDIVQPAPGSDVYLLAQMWQFTPIIKLKVGQTYRLHMSSIDLQHGFSLKPMNMNFQVLPGYDHILTITPTEAGTYQIICNEFCGIGHDTMTGKLIVE
jgi:cytochrome c oxidase subunit II